MRGERFGGLADVDEVKGLVASLMWTKWIPTWEGLDCYVNFEE